MSSAASELEPVLFLMRVELKLCGLEVDLRRQPRVLLLRSEVLLDDVEGFLVDLQVFVGLEELDLVEAVHLLNGDGVSIDAGFFRFLEQQHECLIQQYDATGRSQWCATSSQQSTVNSFV